MPPSRSRTWRPNSTCRSFVLTWRRCGRLRFANAPMCRPPNVRSKPPEKDLFWSKRAAIRISHRSSATSGWPQNNTVMAGISIPLKTQDKNQAGIARAEADQKTAETLLEVARSHTIAEVDAAYEAFDTARGQ